MTQDTLTLRPWGRRWTLINVNLPHDSRLSDAAQHYLMGIMDGYLKTVSPRSRWAGVGPHQVDIVVRTKDASRFGYQLRQAMKQVTAEGEHREAMCEPEGAECQEIGRV